MSGWDELFARLDRIERKLDEIGRRRTTPAGGVPPASVPRPRRLADGSWEVWGGEGTGWIPWLGPDPGKARVP